ncbi:MAG: hypothetical protein RIC14_14040 [Filomicrobium sp.]
MFKLLTVFSGAVALMLIAVLQPAHTGERASRHNCYKDWSEAAQVVSQQNLVSVEKLSRQFKRQKIGKIVKTELCRIGNDYVYRLVIRKAKGRFSSATYDARRGIEIGIAIEAR